MRYYKGCYIDHVVFHNKADIDRFIKENAVAHYRLACELFAEAPSAEHALYCDEQAERLVNQFGFTYEQLEEIETEAHKTVDMRRI